MRRKREHGAASRRRAAASGDLGYWPLRRRPAADLAQQSNSGPGPHRLALPSPGPALACPPPLALPGPSANSRNYLPATALSTQTNALAT